MSEGKHELWELKEMQELPLSTKVELTRARIKAWYEHWNGMIYVSFSGGKDSTVLLDIVRKDYPDVPAVFVDTGLEYPEIRQFVKTWDNVTWLKPKKNYRRVVEEYGFPIISKEVSEKVYYAQKYLKWYLEDKGIAEDKECDQKMPSPYGIADLWGIHGRNRSGRSEEWKVLKQGDIPEEMLDEIFAMRGDAPFKAKALFGTVEHKEKGIATGEVNKAFDFSRHKYLINAPFPISSKCCNVMKKGPAHAYAKQTGRKPMTAQTAAESRLRTMQWLQNGCNGFEMKTPISNPMAFWTEQDVLHYIRDNGLPIASVYGEIVAVDKSDNNQLSLADLGLFEEGCSCLTTTGAKRTGCMFCLYGIHMDKSPNRLEQMKVSHPKIYDFMMRPESKGGLGYAEKLTWVNEHGGYNIKW